jgi:hypothetical protein
MSEVDDGLKVVTTDVVVISFEDTSEIIERRSGVVKQDERKDEQR